MSLPYLKNKDQSIAGLIIKKRTPDKPNEPEVQDSSTGIEACAQDLINAVKNNDVKGVAQAMRDAFDILESQPDEVADDNSYAAQNAKAAQAQKEG